MHASLWVGVCWSAWGAAEDRYFCGYVVLSTSVALGPPQNDRHMTHGDQGEIPGPTFCHGTCAECNDVSRAIMVLVTPFFHRWAVLLFSKFFEGG